MNKRPQWLVFVLFFCVVALVANGGQQASMVAAYTATPQYVVVATEYVVTATPQATATQTLVPTVTPTGQVSTQVNPSQPRKQWMITLPMWVGHLIAGLAVIIFIIILLSLPIYPPWLIEWFDNKFRKG